MSLHTFAKTSYAVLKGPQVSRESRKKRFTQLARALEVLLRPVKAIDFAATLCRIEFRAHCKRSPMFPMAPSGNPTSPEALPKSPEGLKATKPKVPQRFPKPSTWPPRSSEDLRTSPERTQWSPSSPQGSPRHPQASPKGPPRRHAGIQPPFRSPPHNNMPPNHGATKPPSNRCTMQKAAQLPSHPTIQLPSQPSSKLITQPHAHAASNRVQHRHQTDTFAWHNRATPTGQLGHTGNPGNEARPATKQVNQETPGATPG
jgi:hypothetical protein